LNDLVKGDNINCYHMAKNVDLKLGQTCTRYFMNKMSSRRRKNETLLLIDVVKMKEIKICWPMQLIFIKHFLDLMIEQG
jgi:hypothetical protein